jgi:pimeloyl-ACP methyl ester carboxylesterase
VKVRPAAALVVLGTLGGCTQDVVPAQRAPAVPRTARAAEGAEAPGPGDAPPAPLGVAAPPPALPDTPEARVALAFVEALRSGDSMRAAAFVSDPMARTRARIELADAWALVLANAGELVRVAAIVQNGAELEVVARFERGRLAIRLTVAGENVERVRFGRPEPPPYEAPGYVDAGSFRETDVTVGPQRLPGTVTLPVSRARAAVVLVHGSGRLDRDGGVGPNRPYRDLAWGLASRGVAVLRWDKRSFHLEGRRPAEVIDALTLKEESVDDTIAAVRHLRGQPGLAGVPLYVVCHSLGGWAAPRLARADARIAGFVLLASPMRPFEDMLVEQYRYIVALDGTVSGREERELRSFVARVERVKALAAGASPQAQDLPLGLPAGFWRDLSASPPDAGFAADERPVLILQGEADYQVTNVDFELWQRLLADGHARFRSYPALNHLFMHVDGKPSPADYDEPGHVAADVVRDIAEFVAPGAG